MALLQYCVSCGAALGEGARFCGNCGRMASGTPDEPAGVRFCTACGAPLPPSGQLCSACGQPIQDIRYAGFWQRFAAVLIDLLIGSVVGLVPAVVAGAGAGYILVPDDPTKDEEQLGGLAFAAVFALVLWGVLLTYLWVMNARGATLGKRLFGLRVVSLASGGNIGLGSSFLRTFVWYVGTQTPFLIAWLWMIWDNKKQTLHDKAANSVVMKRGD